MFSLGSNTTQAIKHTLVSLSELDFGNWTQIQFTSMAIEEYLIWCKLQVIFLFGKYIDNDDIILYKETSTDYFNILHFT